MKLNFIKFRPISTGSTLRMLIEIFLLKYIANWLYIINDFQTS